MARYLEERTGVKNPNWNWCVFYIYIYTNYKNVKTTTPE